MKRLLVNLSIWFFALNALLIGGELSTYLIETLNGARLVLQKPCDEGYVIKFDKPWEGLFTGGVTIIKDEETYRAFYRGMAETGKEDGSSFEKTCYAESKDGIHWKKPNLGLFEVNGTLENNVILANAAPVTHNFSPFLDTKPGVDQSRRFKALGGTVKSGLIAYITFLQMVSDGKNFRKNQ
jgi:hypothetical protein